jgi:hypothetical protein
LPGHVAVGKFWLNMDSSTITAAVVTFNSTIGLLNTVYKVTQDENIRERVFEIQSALLSLQEQQFAANARYEEKCKETADLRRQLDDRDRWDEKARKYNPFQLAEGMTVYKRRTDCNSNGRRDFGVPELLQKPRNFIPLSSLRRKPQSHLSRMFI